MTGKDIAMPGCETAEARGPQTIEYRNCHSSRDEGLPLGNGHFGGMVFHPPGRLVFVLNHYDVYYRRLGVYARSREGEVFGGLDLPPFELERVEKDALEAKDTPGISYNEVLHPETRDEYGVIRTGAAHVVAGEVTLRLQEDGKLCDRSLVLDIMSGTVCFTIESGDRVTRLEARVLPDGAVLCLEFEISGEPWIEGIDLSIPTIRGRAVQRRAGRADAGISWVKGAFHGDGEGPEQGDEPFQFVVAGTASGWTPDSIVEEAQVRLAAPATEGTFHYLTTVVTEYDSPDVLAAAERELGTVGRALPQREVDHSRYWEDFWSRSSVDLPDRMLERLWHLGLYALDCCCGRGAHLYQQACGLNGLWDVSPPSQWGSTWYWDVNIQQAFWPVYAANHPEIGNCFYDGLESHVPAARQIAREFYHLEGIATDYPHTFYNCMWPWCAQYFWWHYRYSGDLEFLRARAYPLFRGILDFYAGRLQWDEATERYHIFPDVSPEQGPLTRDSIISVACLRFLLHSAIEANAILQEDRAEAERWGELLSHLPEYAQGEVDEFGQIVKDSEWTAADVQLAHSSPLMPLYPLGEVSKRSDPETQELWLRTWRNARKRQAIGTHNFGWLAAASARLGRGDEAVATLYELGIDHQMRTNGMLAEQTERWMQNCLVTVEPVHSPPLAEANGALVAAINEMLLQSFGGVVEVFPAVPASWQDIAFEGFLAEGGFQISARRINGKTAEVSVLSRLGGRLRLANPFPQEQLCAVKEGQPVAVEADDQGLVYLDTEIGGSYRITSVGEGESRPAGPNVDAAGSQVLVRRTRSRRRAILGKDENTDLVRSLDDFTHDFYAGDQIVSPMTVYKFDFAESVELLAKDYREILEPQMHGVGKKGPDFRRVTVESLYSPEVGFGWEAFEDLTYVDRGQPNPLCRDFIEGARPNAFVVDLVAGRYRILILSGDAMAGNDTRISTQLPGRECTVLARTRPGRFATESFAIGLSEDRSLRFEVDSPRPGEQWKLNALLINKVP